MSKSAKVSLTALIFILIQTFSGFILRLFNAQSMTNNGVTILFYVVIYLIPLAVIMLVSKDNIKETLKLKNPGIKNILLSLVITIFLMPFIAFLSYVSMLVFPNIVTEELAFLAQNESFILSVLAIGVFPAVCEEFVFRGKLFSGYKKALPVGKAVLISGLIFGMAHFNMQQFFYAFVIGMVFAVMVNSAGSILVSVIPHFVINSSQVLLTYFLYGESGQLNGAGIERTVRFDLTNFSVILVAAVVFLIPSIILLRKMIAMNAQKIEGDIEANDAPGAEGAVLTGKERMFTAPFWIIVGIYVLNVIGTMIIYKTL